MLKQMVQLKVEGHFGIIIIDHPPVNSLNQEVFREFDTCFERTLVDRQIKTVILVGAGKTFIAGADIKMLQGWKDVNAMLEYLHTNYQRLKLIEDSGKPTIVAIHGAALGGGLEIAMAFHFRIARPTVKVGLPEVKLGVIPGGGGTLRLPRLAGPEKALKMCATGEIITAAEALKFGIIDRIAETPNILEEAKKYANEILAKNQSLTQTRKLTAKIENELENKILFSKTKEKFDKQAKNYPAPLKIIEVMEIGLNQGFEAGEEAEAKAFAEMVVHPTSKNLMHVFFASRETTKIPDIPSEIQPLPVKRIGVVGLGTMGASIAFTYLMANIPVVSKEADENLLRQGIERISDLFNRRVKKGEMTSEEKERKLKLLFSTTDYQDFFDVDLVIETIFEKMDKKKEVFKELDKVCPSHTILATNTSTLSIDEIASVTKRPQRVLGHHFFSPAHVMPLLELVRGEKTDFVTLTTSLEAAKSIKKTPLMVINRPGFLVNRMLHPYVMEACYLVEEGVEFPLIDQIAKEFGMPIGPFSMMDLAGIDVSMNATNTMIHAFPEKGDRPKLLHLFAEHGQLGQKSGAGFYKYGKGATHLERNPEAEKIIHWRRKNLGSPIRRDITPQAIMERLFYIIINEAAFCLQEKIAIRPSDIDVAMILGAGFPDFRGGPLKYAEDVGIEKVFETICQFEKAYGPRWTPAPLLESMVKTGNGFYI